MKNENELATKLFNKKNPKRTNFFLTKSHLEKFIKKLQEIMFPAYNKIETVNDLDLEIKNCQLQLFKILKNVLSHQESDKTVSEIFNGLGEISDLLDLDVQAIYQGDPAATDLEEIISCYPGFFAIFVHRFANLLHRRNIPIIPRMFNEIAHQKTGIDIHPGASIGKYFFIDHGTGIVIGETTIIGDHVKIYQGVTLGALSVDKKMKNSKRHPTIEDHCTVYSNATILGGETVIGEKSIIGGNVWITKSVPTDSIVYHKSEMKFAVKSSMEKKTIS